MTVLLTGARGFAGRHFAAAAREAGLDVLTSSADGEDADLACDVLDPASVAAAIAQARPDAVVNMAGQASVAGSWKEPRRTFELNAVGVLNLLEAVAGQGSRSLPALPLHGRGVRQPGAGILAVDREGANPSRLSLRRQ